MTWIRTIRMEDADEKLRRTMETHQAAYPKEYASAISDDGDNVFAAHTLMPDALYHSFGAYGVMISPELPLTRAQHEMIATMVSVVNRCFY